MGVESLLNVAFKMNKTAHGVKQAPGNGKPQPQSSDQTAAPGIRLIKIIAHLQKLGIRHTDSGVSDIDIQIDAVIFRTKADAHVNAAFLRKLNGIFQKDFENMGNFFCVPDENGRYFRVNIENHLELVAAERRSL